MLSIVKDRQGKMKKKIVCNVYAVLFPVNWSSNSNFSINSCLPCHHIMWGSCRRDANPPKYLSVFEFDSSPSFSTDADFDPFGKITKYLRRCDNNSPKKLSEKCSILHYAVTIYKTDLNCPLCDKNLNENLQCCVTRCEILKNY